MAEEIFRRTLMARIAPALVCAGALSLLVADAMGGRLGLTAWSLSMTGVSLLAGAGLVLALGDEVVVNGQGVHLRNRYLGRRRSLLWGDIREVRPLVGMGGKRSRALCVIPHQGRRLILDSLGRMDRLQELLMAGSDTTGSAAL
jgi:hypothetical protein